MARNSQPTGFSGRFQATTSPTLGNVRKINAKVRISPTEGRSGIRSVPGSQSDTSANVVIPTHAARSATAPARARTGAALACGKRLFLAADDPDGLVEAGERQDLAVVVGQAERHQPLALPLSAYEERHEQPDTGAVHVLELREIQGDGAGRGVGGTRVGVHQRRVHGARQLAAYRDDRNGRAGPPNLERGTGIGHGSFLPCFSGQAGTTGRSSSSVRKSARRVISKISR